MKDNDTELTLKYKLKVITQFVLLMIMAYILFKVFLGVHRQYELNKELKEIRNDVRNGEISKSDNDFGWGRNADYDYE